jgi:very-short-patch-repair endonuclease
LNLEYVFIKLLLLSEGSYDGHTFHEKTEYQTSRDRSIDRELQKLGYQVLRYPGLDIRADVTKVVEDISERLLE